MIVIDNRREKKDATTTNDDAATQENLNLHIVITVLWAPNASAVDAVQTWCHLLARAASERFVDSLWHILYYAVFEFWCASSLTFWRRMPFITPSYPSKRDSYEESIQRRASSTNYCTSVITTIISSSYSSLSTSSSSSFECSNNNSFSTHQSFSYAHRHLVILLFLLVIRLHRAIDKLLLPLTSFSPLVVNIVPCCTSILGSG